MSKFDLTNESFHLFLEKNKNIIVENINFLIIFLLDLEIFTENNSLIYILKNFIEINFPNDINKFNKVIYYIVNNYILNHEILETLLDYDIIDISNINISNYFNTNIQFKEKSYLENTIDAPSGSNRNKVAPSDNRDEVAPRSKGSRVAKTKFSNR